MAKGSPARVTCWIWPWTGASSRRAAPGSSYNGERLGQGREKVKLFLKQNPEIFDAIDARVRKELGLTADAEPETEPVSV